MLDRYDVKYLCKEITSKCFLDVFDVTLSKSNQWVPINHCNFLNKRDNFMKFSESNYLTLIFMDMKQSTFYVNMS